MLMPRTLSQPQKLARRQFAPEAICVDHLCFIVVAYHALTFLGLLLSSSSARI